MNRNRKAKKFDRLDADWQACMMASDLDFNDVMPEKLREEEPPRQTDTPERAGFDSNSRSVQERSKTL